MTHENKLPVAVIGAGPVGMAAAAHLYKRNIPFILFEAGKSVGNSVLSWQHIKVFSPWKFNIDKAARELLETTSWTAPDMEITHTGKQLVDAYLLPLSKLPQLKNSIFTNSKVLAVGRKNLDKMKTKNREKTPFQLRVDQNGTITIFEAKAVIDATGSWLTPNPIGSGGNFAVGEVENAEHIYYGIPDVLHKHKQRYANKKVAVIGGGHSAINTILELEQIKAEYPETEINWILRKNHVNEVYGGQANDALEARGALGITIESLVHNDRINVYTPFQIQEIKKHQEGLTLIGEQYGKKAALRDMDEIISNTGSRPDFSFLKEIRLSISNTVESVDALAELIDPNIHSCGSVRPHGEPELQHPEKDFYMVGAKSYGRAPTFLMATGYEQVRSVVAALAGDMEAARRTELELPETGVCSSGGNNGCCA
ncbi:MAG TPA: NAD(P)-binding domain-containing protein [Flavobacteriales bacterium]|nr:NAD(P)-binding domain-containing protein [Flavobacteriales bacterium]